MSHLGPAPTMASQEKLHSANPSLVVVTNQLTSPQPNQPNSPPAKPQVVFAAKKVSRRVEVTVTPKQKVENPTVEAAIPTNDPGVEAPNESGPIATTPATTVASETRLPNPRLPDPHQQAAKTAEQQEESVNAEARFAIDPFALEVDGQIPVMPTLPIVDAIEMTQKVVSREKAGVHYAWRLKPGPYPDLGNMAVDSVNQEKSFQAPAAGEVQAVDAPPISPDHGQPISMPQVGVSPQVFASQLAVAPTPESPQWAESEVVAGENFDSFGDSFFAQPGEVISIDGNQGYDHIDLRSYSISDASFQPGAILLNTELDGVDINEETPAAITIRHRGIGFAIFKGEVRVEL